MYTDTYVLVTYRKVGSLCSSIVPILFTITHLYSLPFLTSFIIMSSIIRLFPFELYPASMPLSKRFFPYGPILFISHAAFLSLVEVTDKRHNSSTS